MQWFTTVAVVVSALSLSLVSTACNTEAFCVPDLRRQMFSVQKMHAHRPFCDGVSGGESIRNAKSRHLFSAENSTGGFCGEEAHQHISRGKFIASSAAFVLGTFAAVPFSADADVRQPRKTQTYGPSMGGTASELLSDASIKKSGGTLEESISGFVSGASLSITKTLVKYPLDTATVRLQMPNTPYTIRDLPTLFDGSFRGISAPLLSNVPAGAVFFAVKDAVKSSLRESGLPKWLATSLAVAAAQPPYWLARNPSEVVKTRQQAGIEGYGENTTLVDAFRLAMSEEGSNGGGVRELYSGYLENIIYAYPADVIKFLCYEGFSGGRKNLPPLEGAMYGAASTAVAQFVTTPLDVVRNRVMAKENFTSKQIGGEGDSDADGRESISYAESLARLARDEGSKGLFAGATPRIGKALLSGAIQFATYEETKQTINKLFEKRFT